jgi:ketol-acid reductoisomerase
MTMAAVIAAPTSPRQVRAQFEQLLGLHALLAVRQMRSLVATAPALGQVPAWPCRPTPTG